MKKIYLMLSIILGSLNLSAQNTFPSSGNAGIGTTSPTESLDIAGTLRVNRIRTGSAPFKTNSLSSFNSFNTGNDPALSAGWVAADFGGADNDSHRLVIGTGFGGKPVIATHNATLTDWGGPLLIAPFGGNVGIASINPAFNLDVGGSGNFTGQAWFSHGKNSMSGFSWVNAALTTNSIEIVNNNSEVSNSSPTLAFHRFGSGGPQFRLAADGSNVLFLESSGYNSARSPLAYGGGPNSYFSKLFVDGTLDVGKVLNPGDLGSVLARLSEGNSAGSGTFLGVRGHGTTLGQDGRAKSFSLEHGFYGQTNSAINFFRGGAITGGGISFSTDNNTEKMWILDNGNVGIGYAYPSEKLAVRGIIRSEEVVVATGNWPDYVFEKGYDLLPLKDLAQYITENKHLPNMPSAKDIESRGQKLGEINAKLLKTIEELTLHLIEKDNQIKEQESRLRLQEETVVQHARDLKMIMHKIGI